MSIRFELNERVQLDGVEWSMHRRVPEGYQFVSPLTGEFRIFSVEDLLAAFTEGRLLRHVVPKDADAARRYNPLERDYVAIPEHRRATAETRSKFLSALQEECGPRPYSDAVLAAAARKLADLFPSGKPPSTRAIRRWLAKSLHHGNDIRALVPGHPGPREERLKSVEVDEIFMSFFTRAELRNTPYRHLSAVYPRFVQAIKRRNLIRPDDPLPVPSRATFYRWSLKLNDEELTAAMHGRRAAKLKYDIVRRAKDEVAPLSVVEIDHWYMDINAQDRDGLLLGRPKLTVAIDRYSRIVLGFVLTWEWPSFASVMLLLRHMILPKLYVQEAFGGKIRREWLGYGMPDVIVVDNGQEFHSRNFVMACRSLGISIDYAPPRNPQKKGKIERFFRTLRTALFDQMSGVTLSRTTAESSYDPARAAIYTLEEINYFLHRFIVDIYSIDTHNGLDGRAPAELWAEGVERYPVRMPDNVEDLTILASGVLDPRTVQKTGISAFNLYYHSDWLREQRVKRRGNFRLEDIRYDPTDLSAVFVLDDESGRFQRIPCTAPNFTDGLTLWQHRAFMKAKGDRVRGASEEEVLAAKAEFYDELAADAQKHGRRKRTKSGDARLADRPGTPDQIAGREAFAMADLRSPAATPMPPEPEAGPTLSDQELEARLREAQEKFGIDTETL